MDKSTKLHIVFQALLFAVILFLSSCSGSSDSAADNTSSTGSIAFSLEVSPGERVNAEFTGPSIDCEAMGIVSVEAVVYDENDMIMPPGGGPWPCNTGEGIIYNVRKGSNRSVRLFLRDASGEVRYEGERYQVTVMAGQITDLGTIDVHIVPEGMTDASNDHADVYRGGDVSALDDGKTSVLWNDFDAAGRGLTVSKASEPSHGTVELNPDDGTFLYTHDGGPSESDSFTYTITDRRGRTDTATVNITVMNDIIEENQNPILSSGSVSPEEGDRSRDFTYMVHYYDSDGDSPAPIEVSIDGTKHAMTLISGPASDGTYSYATKLSLGDHTYSFSCSDGHGGSAVLPADEDLNGPRVAEVIPPCPAASDDSAIAYRGRVVSVLITGSTSVLGNDVAPAGTTLTVNVTPVIGPTHGALVLNSDGTFSYVNDGSEATTDSFTYQVSDGQGGCSDTAVVSITVVPPPIPPDPVLSEGRVTPGSGDTETDFVYTVHYYNANACLPATVEVNIDGVRHDMNLASGVPGDSVYEYRTKLSLGGHTYSFACADGHGGCAVLPDSGSYPGPDVFRYNHNPVAMPDSATVERGKSVYMLDSGYASVLWNDTDPDGDPLTVITEPVSGPSHGTLTLNPDGTFLYTNIDDGSEAESDSFTYEITDGLGGTDTAAVSIAIRPGSHPPVLSVSGLYPDRGDIHDTFTFSIRYFDEDGDAPLLRYVIIDGIPHAMSLIGGSEADGTYSFSTPLPAGLHEHWFYFVDSSGSSCGYPPSGPIEGPEVYPLMDRYYVAPAPIGNDENDGSPAFPFATIGHAIDVAQGSEEHSAVIHIAGGTYLENVTLDPWEFLRGGYSSDFSVRWDFTDEGLQPSEEFETIIDGGNAGRCITADNADVSVIDGITVRHGTPPSADTGGGGIAVLSCSPDIRNCRIVSNSTLASASSFGGGMFIHSGSPRIVRCEFSGNVSTGSENNYGGGLYCYRSSPVIIDCSFTANHAGCTTGAGGAMFNYQSSPVIRRCIFAGNSAGGGYAMGGALYNNTSSPLVTDCIFTNNSASGSSYGKGGAVFNQSGSPVITNCTFTSNTASSPGGYAKAGAIYNASSATSFITNCILWGDSAPSYKEIYCGSECTLTFNDINQCGFGTDSCRHNMSRDPLFADPERGDLRLQAESPCIDAGSSSAPSLPESDFMGMPRMIGTSPDMGAFEWWGE